MVDYIINNEKHSDKVMRKKIFRDQYTRMKSVDQYLHNKKEIPPYYKNSYNTPVTCNFLKKSIDQKKSPDKICNNLFLFKIQKFR